MYRQVSLFSFTHDLLYYLSFSQDKSVQPWKEKYNNDDGIELMIPAYNPDLVPDIIYCLLRSEGVEDISEEYVSNVQLHLIFNQKKYNVL